MAGVLGLDVLCPHSFAGYFTHAMLPHLFFFSCDAVPYVISPSLLLLLLSSRTCHSVCHMAFPVDRSQTRLEFRPLPRLKRVQEEHPLMPVCSCDNGHTLYLCKVCGLVCMGLMLGSPWLP